MRERYLNLLEQQQKQFNTILTARITYRTKVRKGILPHLQSVCCSNECANIELLVGH